MSAAEESDVEQARVFLALLNSEIDALSEGIESALRLVRVRSGRLRHRRRAPTRRALRKNLYLIPAVWRV